MNFSFFESPHDERSTYNKDLNCSWSTKSYHYRAALFNFIFIYTKRISSLVFVSSGRASCFFDEDVHPFTSLLIITTRLLLLHLCIPISSYSLLIPIISLFTVSTWLFLLRSFLKLWDVRKSLIILKPNLE